MKARYSNTGYGTGVTRFVSSADRRAAPHAPARLNTPMHSHLKRLLTFACRTELETYR